MTKRKNEYPVKFTIDYQKERNRLTSFFRLFTFIPIAIVYLTLVSSTQIIFFPLVLTLIFQKKYPKWWFDFNLELYRFSARLFAYAFLLVDDYPSTDEEQHVHLDVDYPNVEKDLRRSLAPLKFFLAIPHFIILCLLFGVSILLTFWAWLSILFTGKYPKNIFDFHVGLYLWGARVGAYAVLLTTDIYPPFRI